MTYHSKHESRLASFFTTSLRFGPMPSFEPSGASLSFYSGTQGGAVRAGGCFAVRSRGFAAADLGVRILFYI